MQGGIWFTPKRPPPLTSVVEYKIGQAKVPGKPEPVDAIVFFNPVIRKVTLNEAVDVLIQKKMVESGFVCAGGIMNDTAILDKWYIWLGELGLDFSFMTCTQTLAERIFSSFCHELNTSRQNGRR